MAYFSNSTEGDVLDRQCADCPIGEDEPCPTAWVQMTYNYDQMDKGQEKLREALNALVDERGRRCKTREILMAKYRKHTQREVQGNLTEEGA